ncbi:hypothetical protein [Aerococcus kribbianus]|uniref:Uncharacterized protein n=1 Tax=Aerococcus kribbianus TaxID=2999064 RepID=A0A9X3FTT5_9LACT|nr:MULTISPECIES: hypothetical protein [unclassified Aerococcus]MCZ0716741.1 hypothetical protein [Aerococcus sp. YH-aer221]MCZ0725029.1 hypothetical protein [Aerococcus sp. YH-aer222]
MKKKIYSKPVLTLSALIVFGWLVAVNKFSSLTLAEALLVNLPMLIYYFSYISKYFDYVNQQR